MENDRKARLVGVYQARSSQPIYAGRFEYTRRDPAEQASASNKADTKRRLVEAYLGESSLSQLGSSNYTEVNRARRERLHAELLQWAEDRGVDVSGLHPRPHLYRVK